MLGAGESGKSTFGKQLRMMTKGAVAEREKKFYRKGTHEDIELYVPGPSSTRWTESLCNVQKTGHDDSTSLNI